MSTDPRIAAALARAERFRRDQVPAAERHGVEQRVWAEPLWWSRQLGDGWWAVGQVFIVDDWQSSSLPVHWHPKTDRVRVGRPAPRRPEPVLAPSSPRPTRPLWPIAAGGTAAEDGWIFTLRGQDYTPREAERRASSANLSEWTWRRTPDDQ